MPTATANYHVTSPEEQAFLIDADGELGKLVSPVLEPAEIKLSDARNPQAEVDFAHDSLSFGESGSAVSDFNASNDWEATYNRELVDLLAREIGANETIVFDHTVRIDDPNALRKPARNVHSDYSIEGAHQRLRDLVGAEKVAEFETGHFGFVNVWRPIEHPIHSAPLGFVRPRSVAEEDWITLKLIYPDRLGSILGLVANDAHEWVYLSQMTPDEVAIFNIYDNRGKPSIAHSALDMIEDPGIAIARKSIESRTLVKY